MPEKPQLAILDDYQGVALGLAQWERISDQMKIKVFNDYIPPQAITMVLNPFHIIFCMRERTTLTAELLATLPNLKLIVTAGPLNAAIDVSAAQSLGITVCGTGYTSHSTIELTWALILATARNIVNQANAVRNNGWQVELGADLHGKTLGVIGLDSVGSGVARVGSAFGMQIIAWSQNMTAEQAMKHGARYVSKETLYQSADVVTVHLRLSERTRGLVGQDEFRRMKPSAIIINTSRGPIIDEQALCEALLTGAITGAGVDVFDTEPLPLNHHLRNTPGLTATPHIGYVSVDLYQRFFRQSLENIEAWLAGSPNREVPDYARVESGFLPDWIAEACNP